MSEAQELIDALEDAGCDPESYSGRGMYGKQCVSIRIDSDGDLWDIANALGLSGIDTPAPRTDSMGRGIVAYWPRIEWPSA